MLKMKSTLQIELNGRQYEFYCQPDSPIQDAIEANSQFGAFLLGKQAQAQQAAPQVEAVPETQTQE